MATILPWRSRPPARRRGNPNAVPQSAITASAATKRETSAVDSLVAAGFRITHQDTDQLRRLIQPWQARSFSYYDRLGEINYAAQFYARMLSPLRLFAAEKDENGDWVETDDPAAKAALERIQDPGGGTEGLLSSYGRLMFLAGECYLFCSLNEDTETEQWEMLSTDELRIQSGVYIRYKSPSLTAEEYHEPREEDWEPVNDDTAIAYRLWKKHPRYSMLADSTMKGVLDLCEELLLLTLAVRARARSRLASAGILLVADEISYTPLEPVTDEDIEVDPLLADLTAAMMAAIQNEGSPSAVVPIVVRAPQDVINNGGIKHIQIVDPTQLYPETGLRRECIERIAIGLDMPPEILLGMSDANHWTVWMIDEQTWKAHGQPIANQFVNDLTAAYFRPQLRAEGVQDWQRFAIAYDASAIINHPDRFSDAQKAFDRRAIGKAALRDAGGFAEDDAPTEDELNEMIGVAVRDGSLALYGIPSVKAGGIETQPGEVVSPTGEAGVPTTTPTTGAEVEPGPPAADAPSPDEGLRGSLSSLEAARIAGAADLALLRAREAAGNRLRSLAKRNPELRALVEDVPARDVAAVLGPENVRALGITDARELVGGAADLLGETIKLWRIDLNGATSLIAEQLTQHAARTLFELRPMPLPPQFRTYVAGVLDAS